MVRFLLLTFLVLGLRTAAAQGLQGKVTDVTGSGIPFATVAYGVEKGVITNGTGEFSIVNVPPDIKELIISAMGFETKTVLIADLNQKPIELKSKSIDLDEVFVSNKNLTGEEIIELVKLRADTNYRTSYRKKQFFIRDTYNSIVNQLDIEVEKSSIEELNQELINKFLENVPKNNSSYTEKLGDYYGKGNKASIDMHKVANLDNPAATGDLDELTKYLEQIIKDNVKTDSYYKIKSGIIGFKVDADEMGLDEMGSDTIAPKEKTEEEKLKDSTDRMERMHKSARLALVRANNRQFWKEDIEIDVFQKPRKYEFIRNGYMTIDGESAYRIEFVPKRSAKFQGVMYVNTVDFGVYRLEYRNVKPLSKFSLFGISHKEDVSRGIYLYAKKGDVYDLAYCEFESGETTGISRPLKIIEKNKNVRGRRKQNELDMDIDLVVSNINKMQLIFLSDENLTEEAFENLTIDDAVTIKSFTKYDPEYWSDYTIIQPDEALKQFDLTGIPNSTTKQTR